MIRIRQVLCDFCRHLVPDGSVWVGLQAAKAQALGPWHNTAALQTTVAEPWLSSVMADAAKAKEAGWFWQFKINSVKVQSSSSHTCVEPQHLGCHDLHARKDMTILFSPSSLQACPKSIACEMKEAALTSWRCACSCSSQPMKLVRSCVLFSVPLALLTGAERGHEQPDREWWPCGGVGLDR